MQRCNECGSTYMMEYVGPPDDPHDHGHHRMSPSLTSLLNPLTSPPYPQLFPPTETIHIRRADREREELTH